MPIALGKLDWSVWIYGLFAAFLGGGAASMAAGAATTFIDPDHFNLAHPRLILKAMVATFVFSGLPAFFAYLHQNPLPSIITVTEVKTTSLQQHPPAIVEQTVKTTETKPAEGNEKS